jgi:hypothetical protein
VKLNLFLSYGFNLVDLLVPLFAYVVVTTYSQETRKKKVN